MPVANETLRYRGAFEVHSIQGDGDPFAKVTECIATWIVDKERSYASSPIVDDVESAGNPFPLLWFYHTPQDYRGGVYDDDEWPALACEAAQDAQGRITQWAAEYDEPDTSHEDRRWHTTFYVERRDDTCHVTMENTCRALDENEEPPQIPVASPSIVRTLIDLPWYVSRAGSTQLQTVPHKLSAQTFEHFRDDLLDSDRTIPLVLFCTGYDSHVPEQAKQLARRAMGNANVYILDWGNEELRELEQDLFEKGTPAGEYACPKASARMYLPGIDLENPDASRSHESWNRAALTSVRPSIFAERLARRFLPNEPTPTILDLWPNPGE